VIEEGGGFEVFWGRWWSKYKQGKLTAGAALTMTIKSNLAVVSRDPETKRVGGCEFLSREKRTQSNT
jgi:hypothetical protein